ncbi:amino acid/polyamine/organocation transporter, APC superfamily [Granulicella rosea]|uniref:Amino acid/polyamine/organocation transporter, APC superfamily n=1 Tax=Granulicella rosea TaxID=474952 RepID=A0A239LRV8_9BACT|nr:APC family permease [Granulicella rosea]SNT32429.1 amino acid/polyamine/organocation transporter, APC superfamily [Granulicella rosea]
MEQMVVDTVEAIPSSGLRAGILSPTEVLAQSISTIAPTTTPTMTIPLVFALCGAGTWFAYLLAMIAMLLVGLCVSRFARYSSCAGSVYTYVSSSMPPLVGGIAAWALLLAYVATACSVAGGFINYANVFAVQMLHHTLPGPLLGLVCVAAATFIAYRDVQVSARMMLWIEAASIVLISVVLALLIAKSGLHLDLAQLSLHGVAQVKTPGIVLAIFSFVGFESATTLGTEARNPQRTIPRAVIQSAFFAGCFFILCSYLETQGMAALGQNLGKSDAPMRALSAYAGVGPLGQLIDLGALVSLFACTLACLTAAARVLLRMGQDGLAHRSFAKTHSRNATPGAAVIATGLLTAIPVMALAAKGVSGMDIYGYTGSLAVYGFLTVYGLAAIALPRFLKTQGHLNGAAIGLSIAAVCAMLAALGGTLYPVPEAPYNWLPYVYLAYIAGGIAWQMFKAKPATV